MARQRKGWKGIMDTVEKAGSFLGGDNSEGSWWDRMKKNMNDLLKVKLETENKHSINPGVIVLALAGVGILLYIFKKK